jgi:hypothetical protein
MLFRKKPRPEEIQIKPINATGELCVASPWGDDQMRHCPFLDLDISSPLGPGNKSFCQLWSFYPEQNPERAASCPVRKLALSLADK